MQSKDEVNLTLLDYNLFCFVFLINSKLFRLLETKVRNMMKEKQDYKAWYYVPVPIEPMEMKEQYIQNLGKQGYDAKYTK